MEKYALDRFYLYLKAEAEDVPQDWLLGKAFDRVRPDMLVDIVSSVWHVSYLFLVALPEKRTTRMFL